MENIWVKPWAGCGAMDVRAAHATGELSDALAVKGDEEDLLASGVAETEARKRRRMLREDRRDGVFPPLSSLRLASYGLQSNASPMRRTDGCRMHVFTLPAPRSLGQSGTHPREA